MSHEYFILLQPINFSMQQKCTGCQLTLRKRHCYASGIHEGYSSMALDRKLSPICVLEKSDAWWQCHFSEIGMFYRSTGRKKWHDFWLWKYIAWAIEYSISAGYFLHQHGRAKNAEFRHRFTNSICHKVSLTSRKGLAIRPSPGVGTMASKGCGSVAVAAS